MIYPIVVYGDPVLREPCQDIEEGKDVKELIRDMYEVMHAANGVGLAAPQIGMGIRLFVVDGTTVEDEPTLSNFKKAFINPEILEESGSPIEYEEGCLSIPQVREMVGRPPKIKIKYFNEDWEEVVEEYDGFAARIIQHEHDHLEGILFIDYLTPFKRKMLKRKLDDISKGLVDIDYKIKIPKRK